MIKNLVRYTLCFCLLASQAFAQTPWPWSPVGPGFFNGNVTNTAAVVTTPSTGGTVTFTATQALAIIEPAGTLATLTVTLPACATTNDGDERQFSLSQIITALTVGASAGTVIGGSTSAVVGSGHKYHCVGASAKWYQLN